MYEDLREKAIKNIKEERLKKRGVQITGFTFFAVSIVLYVVSLNFNGPAAYWIKFPILILAMVYGIIHISVFGVSIFGENEELTTEEIEREIIKIYQSTNLDELSKGRDELELRQIEDLREKYDQGDELV